MRIIITGSQGFIGHHIYNHLKYLGHDVTGIDIVNNGFHQDWIYEDLLNMNKLTIQKVDIIIHCAADVGGMQYLSAKKRLASYNLKLDTKVAELCRESKAKLIYFSSSCANELYDEYGKEKKVVENLLRVSGLKYLVIRPQNVYGVEDPKPRIRENVVMALFRKIHSNPIRLFGTGEELRSFIYVSDLAEIVSQNLDKEGLIQVGGEWIKIKSLVNLVLTTANRKRKVIFDGRAQKPKLIIKFNKTKTSLKEGIGRTYIWNKSQLR